MKLDNVIAERSNKVLYRDGDICIKVFNEDYSKSGVLNEALNHARVEETGLNIPALHEVSTSSSNAHILTKYVKTIRISSSSHIS